MALVQGQDGSGVWGAANGAVAPTGKKLEEFQAEIHLRRVLTLHPLLNDKGFKLADAGEVKVDEQPRIARHSLRNRYNRSAEPLQFRQSAWRN